MSSTHSSSGISDALKKGVGIVHGTGEALRGNLNAAVDQASGDRVGVEKNTAIASRGADEIERGYHRETLDSSHAVSTNYGSHGSDNTGNKLDPRFDSDLDHRGASGAGSTTAAGTHVASTGEPRV